MRPSFALTLSFDGIGLLHRTPAGWLRAGFVALDTADLPSDLHQLHATAMALEPGGFTSKLIIPNEQIRYFTLDTAQIDDADLPQYVTQALDGQTPYAVQDLAFDFERAGRHTHVAAVALETLAEAEDFALEHAFNPVSFVAIPDAGDFPGEPFFGLATAAGQFLGDTAALTRDVQALRVVGDIEHHHAAPAAAPAPAADSPNGADSADSSAQTGASPAEAPDTTRPAGANPAPPTKQATQPATPPAASAPKAPTPAADGAAAAPSPSFSTNRTAPPQSRKQAIQQERRRLTLFGARANGATSPAIGGKPRHLGLVLTGVLLVFLATVAAWAALFSDRDTGALAPPTLAALPQPDIADEDTLAIEGPEAEAPPAANLANLPDPANIGTPEALTRLPNAAPLSPPEAAARYAATGIWQVAPDQPPTPDTQAAPDPYIASLDGKVHIGDAIALPNPAGLARDTGLAAQPSPAARGTEFDLDARGLVRAAPDGALTPDGVPVFAGRPGVLPPALPTRPTTTPEAGVLPEALQRLAPFRPRLRPDDLVQINERSQLGGLTRNELALIRPKLRPETAQAANTPAATATAPAPADSGPASALAIAQSLKPQVRPNTIDRAVQQALLSPPPNATRNTETDSTPAPQATIAPSGPTSNTVAREATVRNVLNLGQMNLIGVYGKAASRSALIRMSNGRYRKVQVGDNLDGGRVAAIDATELRYVKSGRSIVLKMPRG